MTASRVDEVSVATGSGAELASSEAERVATALRHLRAELDAIDPELIELLGRRIAIAERVALVKSEHEIPVMQHDRVRLVKERNARLGEAAGLDPGFVERIFGLIIDEMCRIEDALVERR